MDPVLLERERILFRMNEEINAKSRGLFELNENIAWMTTKRRMKHSMKKQNNNGGGGSASFTDESTNAECADKENGHGAGGTGSDEEPDSYGQSTAGSEKDTAITIGSVAVKEEIHQLQLVKVTTMTTTTAAGGVVGERKVNNSAVAHRSSAAGRQPGQPTTVTVASASSAGAKNFNRNMADVVPKVLEKKNISSEGLIKFLKSKVAILQTELDGSQRQNVANVKDLNLALDRLKQLEAYKEQLLTKNTALERTVKKYEERNLELDRLTQEKEAQLASTGKEVSVARSEIRNLAQINQSLEKRLHKAHEELDNVRIKLNIANDAEKETRDAARQERSTYEKHIKQLRKQRTEVLADYKKLLQSVDHLKKQQFNQEQAKLMGDFEKDYFRHLEDSSSSVSQ